MGADLELFYTSCHPEHSEESLCNTLSLALSYRTDVRYLYIFRFLVVALYCDDSTVILNITSVWLVILSEVKDLKKRFFVTFIMAGKTNCPSLKRDERSGGRWNKRRTTALH